MKKLFKNQIKLIRSLDSKKGRNESGLFIIESKKAVLELVGTSINIEYVVFDSSFETEKIDKIVKLLKDPDIFITDDFERISSLKNSEGVLAVAKTPSVKTVDEFLKDKRSLLGLFDINDPGNLGTIIRTSLWYGVDGIVLFGNTVDLYSPKVIRSSMGGLFKSDIIKLGSFDDIKKEINSFEKIGTFLDEEHDFKSKDNDKIMLLFGNEANGLSSSLKKEINHNYRINNKTDFESLNVSIAAGIIMDRIFNHSN
ncbi:MAG: RNA methyltransferase [Candidatus Delongbacteria bacterium]|nr:RNA methyltransferase [Candidatus Delongbacteria bacterium]